MKKILRSTYHTLVLVVFLLIAAVGLTRTRAFHSYVRTLVVAELMTLVDGEIEMGAIEGNLATGFHINNVGIRKNGQEIFFTERLEARYDPLGLLVQRASVSRISLLRPRIHLWRTAEQEWNIDQVLVKKTEQDTTPSSWILDFRQIELLGATVSVVDSFALQNRSPETWENHPANAFDYADVTLSPLTLRASLRVQGKTIGAVIHSLDFETERPKFTVNLIAGEFLLSPEGTEIRKLTVKTPHTTLSLDARLGGANPLAVGNLRELEHSATSVDLSVDKLEFDTFKRFLPGPVDFLGSEASLELRARGAFGRLRIDEVQVRTPRTFIRIAGTIDNLHNPKELALDLHAEDNIIHPADLEELLPGLGLPDLQPIGVLSCSYTFKGRPTHFAASVKGEVAAGGFETGGTLDLRRQPMIYDGTVQTMGLNVGTLLKSEKLPSHLNTKGTFSGSGTRIEDMTALFRVQADTSSFLGLPLDKSVIVVDVADRVVRSNLLVNLGQTRIDLNSHTQFRKDDSTLYTLNGKIISLNLADVLQDKSYESDLSFDIAGEGTAYFFDPARTHTNVSFLRSTFRQETFEDRTLEVDYRGEDSLHQTLQLTSEPIDINVGGRFTALGIIETFRRTGTILTEALAHRFANLDSLRTTAPTGSRQPFRSRTGLSSEPLEATVSIAVKDFHPLGVVLGAPLEGASDIRIDVVRGPNDLHLQGDIQIDEFDVRLPSASIGIVEGRTWFDLGDLQRVHTLETLRSNLEFTARQVFYDSLMVSGVRISHRLSDDSSAYSLTGVVDSTIGIEAEGTSLFVPNLIRLNLSKLNLSVADYGFENSDPIDLVFGKDGIRVSTLTMQHEAEGLTMTGILDPAGISDIEFSVENFLIRNLRNFSRNESFVEKVQDFNGVLDAKGSFSGNFKIPRFDLSLNANGVTVGQAVFGQVSGRGSYADGLSDIFLEFRSRPEERNLRPELLVSGRMPMKLGDVSPGRTSQGMDLTIQSTGFRMEFLDPFIPVTRNLTGTLQADLKMRGTLSEPLYEGSLSIQNARFLFTPLGITYNLNGLLIPNNRRITFRDLKLSNISEDRVPGLIDGLGSMGIEGGLTLEGFEVKEFDLTANGQLLIMKENARLQGLPLYGNVFVGSGSNRLRWFGTPDRSYVTGDLLMKNASITFPPSRDLAFEENRLFSVDFVDDTTRVVNVGIPPGRTHRDGNGGDLLSRSARRPPGEGTSDESFLDKIEYNLSLETSGLTQVRFVFNQLTNEELFADLKGRLVFTKDPSASRLTGELQVGPRSYYRYFKTLQATGKLLFTGEVTNPELDILATYEGTYQPDTNRVGMSEEDKREQRVLVRLTITGTRQEPKVKMGLEVHDLDGNKKEERADAQSDAIAFLVSGRFKDEMTQSQQTSLTTNLLGSIGTSLLSGPLTDFVRSQIGYITSVDVVYYGGINRSFGDAADLRITGEVGDAVIRLGGRVLSGDLSNANVSVQFPMSSVVGSEAWRNLILELERRVEGVESIEQRRPSNGLKLLYRITF